MTAGSALVNTQFTRYRTVMTVVTAKNLTNSPFDFLDANNARVRFPAFGVATGDFVGSQLDLLNFWIAAGGFTDKVPPTNTVAPTITGTLTVGQVLTSTPGTWTGSPTYTRVWQRSANGTTGWAAIAGATGATYTLVEADATQHIRVIVTATNANGATPVTTAPRGPVAAA